MQALPENNETFLFFLPFNDDFLWAVMDRDDFLIVRPPSIVRSMTPAEMSLRAGNILKREADMNRVAAVPLTHAIVFVPEFELALTGQDRQLHARERTVAVAHTLLAGLRLPVYTDPELSKIEINQTDYKISSGDSPIDRMERWVGCYREG